MLKKLNWGLDEAPIDPAGSSPYTKWDWGPSSPSLQPTGGHAITHVTILTVAFWHFSPIPTGSAGASRIAYECKWWHTLVGHAVAKYRSVALEWLGIDDFAVLWYLRQTTGYSWFGLGGKLVKVEKSLRIGAESNLNLTFCAVVGFTDRRMRM